MCKCLSAGAVILLKQSSNQTIKQSLFIVLEGADFENRRGRNTCGSAAHPVAVVVINIGGDNGSLAFTGRISHHFLQHAAEAVGSHRRGRCHVPLIRPVAINLCCQFPFGVILIPLGRGIGPCAAHKPSGGVVVIADARPVGEDKPRQIAFFVVPHPESMPLAIGTAEGRFASVAIPGIGIVCSAVQR